MSIINEIRNLVDSNNINFPSHYFNDEFKTVVYQFMGCIAYAYPHLSAEMCNILLNPRKTKREAMGIAVAAFSLPEFMDVLYVILERNNISEDAFMSRVINTYTRHLNTSGSRNVDVARLYRIFDNHLG